MRRNLADLAARDDEARRELEERIAAAVREDLARQENRPLAGLEGPRIDTRNTARAAGLQERR